MGCWSHQDRWSEQDGADAVQDGADAQPYGAASASGFGPPSSGNRAFDEYRMETLRRLEEEQTEFRDFLDRLRHAKDKEEFDQFMAQHRQRPTPPRMVSPSSDCSLKPQAECPHSLMRSPPVCEQQTGGFALGASRNRSTAGPVSGRPPSFCRSQNPLW